MGKNKLARWNELASFSNVIQPSIDDVVEINADDNVTDLRFPSGNVKVKNHSIKGKWHNSVFKNSNPVILELGCGKGEYTIGLAKQFPDRNFIGVDIKGARMWRGAKTSNDESMENVAFLRTRIEFLSSFFAPDEADEIWVTFPDPHPGARNANKRLTSPWYLNSYRSLIKNKSIIHLKTDNRELFSYTEKIVRKNNLELLHCTDDLYSGNLPLDILTVKTHYEKMFLKCGMKICYISFRLDAGKIIID